MLAVSVASAQFSPVNWTYKAESIQDGTYKLVFTADIESGWYVYSQFLDDGGPIPTSFTFTTEDGIEIIGAIEESGAHKKESFDELFEMNLIKYGEQVTFVQKVKVKPGVKLVSGYLTFMTCNDESCLPPKDVDFEINLN